MTAETIKHYHPVFSLARTFRCILIFSILFACLILSACDNVITKDNVKVKAGCVTIYYEGDDNYTYIGTLRYAMSGWNLSYGPMHPSVVIFRGIPQYFKDKKLKTGGAYLDSKNGFEYLGMVDLSLSDEELAKLFSVNIDDLPEQADVKPEAKKGFIVRADGDKWYKFGIFVHKNNSITKEISRDTTVTETSN